MRHVATLMMLCLVIAVSFPTGCGCDETSDSSDDDSDFIDDDTGTNDDANDDANDDLDDDVNDDADDDLDDDVNDDTDDDADDDDDVDTARCLEQETVHVALTGADDESCGGESAPCLTIGHGLSRASAGDAVCVHSGTYNESWLVLPDEVTLISSDGALEAKIFSGAESAVRFINFVDNAGIDGFEVYGSWNEGSAGDGLIRVFEATNVKIKNVMAHDAPYDMDVIKVSGQVSGLLIENVVAWNPAHRTNGVDFQEDIDIFGSGAEAGDPPPVSDITVRGCWLFHTEGIGDWLMYSKINAENILYENNIFGPSAGMGPGNPGVGIGTGEAGIPDSSAAVVTHAIVRNNIFVGIKGDGAFSVMNSDDTWVYNNHFYGNSGAETRSVIMLRGNTHELGATGVFNNVFVNNYPSKNGDGKFFWVRNNLPDPWHLHNNFYYDNLETTDTPYAGDADSVYDVDPLLADPAVPDITNPNLDRIAEIKAGFAIAANSPALGAGVNAVGIDGHPNWSPGVTDKKWDYEKDTRPSEDSWDLGADELE